MLFLWWVNYLIGFNMLYLCRRFSLYWESLQTDCVSCLNVKLCAFDTSIFLSYRLTIINFFQWINATKPPNFIIATEFVRGIVSMHSNVSALIYFNKYIDPILMHIMKTCSTYVRSSNNNTYSKRNFKILCKFAINLNKTRNTLKTKCIGVGFSMNLIVM